jgi:diguanylate cyclase (GGDEF)-like protein
VQSKTSKFIRILLELDRTKSILLIVVLFALSFMLELLFNVHEHTDAFLESYEALQADGLYNGAFLAVLAFLVIKQTQLRLANSEQQAAKAEALRLSLFDSLTGLANRRKLENDLAVLPPGGWRALLMIDLDDFKPINDVFGHAAGDLLLIKVAERLRAACGEASLVCRFGGDEFVILSPPLTAAADAEGFARIAVAAFDDGFDIGGAQAPLRASIGICRFRIGEIPVLDVIRRADIALYHAKEESHTAYRLFEPQMDEETVQRSKMERKLRHAITVGAVRPHYQPLVNLTTGDIVGFEALARWHDDEFGQVPPDIFIPLAEETGLITNLAEHLLRCACQDASKWPHNLKLSFNLSPRQLRNGQTGLRILKVLAETGFAPHRLEVEVTESSLIADKPLAKQLLASLHDAGVSVAIDDFGTGYSSLNHLQEFKFDNLKIDRGFVLDMQPGNRNEVIVSSILKLSQGLGLKATAEGIENKEQLEELMRFGCEQGQGYLFSRPVPASGIPDLLIGWTANRKTA